MSKRNKKIVAKTIRVVTIPPLIVTALLIFLYFFRPGIYRGASELVAATMFLAVIPTLAYPLQPFIPKFKDKGRTGQRTLAFITSFAGYAAGAVYAFCAGVTWELKFIFLTYLVSVFMLVILNKFFHLRASGHSCGVLGPLIHAVYFLGWGWMVPCALTALLVMWSSVYLTRHTPSDLFFGGLSAVTAFSLCLIFI